MVGLNHVKKMSQTPTVVDKSYMPVTKRISQPPEWILLKHTFVRRVDIQSITRYSIQNRPNSIYFGIKIHSHERIDVYPEDPGYEAVNTMIAPAWDEYLIQWRREQERIRQNVPQDGPGPGAPD